MKKRHIILIIIIAALGFGSVVWADFTSVPPTYTNWATGGLITPGWLNAVEHAIIGTSTNVATINGLATTTGNIIVGSSTGGWSVLAVGTNGQCLVATSSAPLGIAWTSCASIASTTVNGLSGSVTIASTSPVTLVVSGQTISIGVATGTQSQNGILVAASSTNYDTAYTYLFALNTSTALNNIVASSSAFNLAYTSRPTSSIVTTLNSLAAAVIATGTTNHITVSSSTGQLVFDISANYTPSSTIPALPITVANGGTNKTSFTAGSLVFASTTTILGENNSNLFWDNSKFSLGIGTNNPTALDSSAAMMITGDNGVRDIVQVGAFSGGSQPVNSFRTSEGTTAAPTTSTLSDNLGETDYYGYANGAYKIAGLIDTVTNAAPANGDTSVSGNIHIYAFNTANAKQGLAVSYNTTTVQNNLADASNNKFVTSTVVSSTIYTAGTGLLTLNNTLNVSSSLASSTWGSFTIYNPTSTTKYAKLKSNSLRILSFASCETDTATDTVSLVRFDSLATTTNTSILTIACGLNGATSTTFGTSTIPSGSFLGVSTTVSGAPTYINFYLESTKQ